MRAGNLVDAYGSLLESRDANLPTRERLVSDPAIEAVAVTRVETFGGCTLGGHDTGRQTLKKVLAVSYRGAGASDRSSNERPSRLQAVISPELLNSTTAPIVYYRLTGTGSTPIRTSTSSNGNAETRPAPPATFDQRPGRPGRRVSLRDR
ncbi:MAG: hypothetical protein R2735_13005 [Microthrixaceae bacterium]